MERNVLLLLLLLCFSPAAWSYSSGKITGSCDSMMPRHGTAEAQTGTSPYTITVDRTDFNLGDQVMVELKGTASDSFEGFLLKATEVGGETAVGSFTVSADAQLLDCSQKANSGVSHTSAAPNNLIKATWRPDPAGSGSFIQFSATFVKTKATFWVAVKSLVLNFTGNITDGSGGSAKTETPAIVKAHGALMLVAWMTTGTLGMIVARYLKGTAKGHRLFNKDLWFVVHIPVMCFTVAATIVAFILIFVYAKDWAGGVHPVLGCLVMILSFIQPIFALMRCEPQDSRRYIFNWTHSLNAVVMKVLAVAAIFTGLELLDHSSSQWMVKTMSGFAAWECLFYMFIEGFHRWRIHSDGLGSKTKNTDSLLVGLFFLGNIAFLVTLLLGIGTATVVP